MDYNQAIDFLYSQLPMYQRVGASAYKKDLTNTIHLLEELGNPHKKFKSVHIAGTNGKGSSAHFIASILQSSHYKVGLYTSPHLKSFTERIRVNGQPVPEDFVVDFVNKIAPVLQMISPSFFEITVALAFDYFAECEIDIAVIEVGLGGRLDSTNVIQPELSLITNISLDHTDMLGKTLKEIAGEKAGIIKENVPVVIGKRQKEVEDVFIQKAKTERAPILFAQDHIRIERDNGLIVYREGQSWLKIKSMPLNTEYTLENLTGILQCVEVLRLKGYRITGDNIISGIENMITNTGLKGRWQILGQKPLVICDIAHNIEGISTVLREIAKYEYDQLIIVWGSVKEKDINSILSILPRNAFYIFCQPEIPRAMNAEELLGMAKENQLDGISIPSVEGAYNYALEKASENDFVFIGGSTFVVAEIPNL